MPQTTAIARRRVKKFAVSLTAVQRRIYMIRGVKVMLDEDLAGMYGVPTKRLNEAVRRNASRFPEDFMFELTRQEIETLNAEFLLRNQPKHGGRRTAPLAFTDLGVAMLSSVLNSEFAVQANIQIMRAFVQMRELIAVQEDLVQRIDSLERGQESHGEAIRQLHAALHEFCVPAETPRRHYGFTGPREEDVRGRARRSPAKPQARPALQAPDAPDAA
jgi:hypothetical protein